MIATHGPSDPDWPRIGMRLGDVSGGGRCMTKTVEPSDPVSTRELVRLRFTRHAMGRATGERSPSREGIEFTLQRLDTSRDPPPTRSDRTAPDAFTPAAASDRGCPARNHLATILTPRVNHPLRLELEQAVLPRVDLKAIDPILAPLAVDAGHPFPLTSSGVMPI